MKRRFYSFVVPFALIGMNVPAKASLVLLNDVQLNGQGIGAQTTALTLQSPNNTSTESGGVNLGGAFGNALTGASQSQLFSLAGLGLSNASQLGLILNLSEPGSESPPSVILDSLTLTAFGPSGSTTNFNLAPQYAGITLNQIAGGLGGSGIVFALDSAQAAQLTALGTRALLGVTATFGGAQGGPDAIQAVALAAAVPEPATWAMMLAGLFGLGFISYRRGRAPAPLRREKRSVA